MFIKRQFNKNIIQRLPEDFRFHVDRESTADSTFFAYNLRAIFANIITNEYGTWNQKIYINNL